MIPRADSHVSSHFSCTKMTNTNRKRMHLKVPKKRCRPGRSASVRLFFVVIKYILDETYAGLCYAGLRFLRFRVRPVSQQIPYICVSMSRTVLDKSEIAWDLTRRRKIRRLFGVHMIYYHEKEVFASCSSPCIRHISRTD